MNAQVNIQKTQIKPQMTLSHLNRSGAKRIAVMYADGNLFEDYQFKNYPESDLTKNGFYFLLNHQENVVARFYIGRQRSKCGFEAVARHIRSGRSSICKRIMTANECFEVYYVPTENMKPLTTAAHKGTLGTIIARAHNDRYQNLEEMNRILSDNFKFLFQKF